MEKPERSEEERIFAVEGGRQEEDLEDQVGVIPSDFSLYSNPQPGQ